MLSILIPSYNFDCTQLVKTLLTQLPNEAEIIVGDDCSTQEDVSMRLQTLNDIDGVRTIRPPHNLGSAGMRNLLCHEASGDYLLFIDCDAIIEDPGFISQYLKETDGCVVCGTVRHPETMPSPQQSLRWKYEKAAEANFTAEACNVYPYRHFRTFHFLAPKSFMLQVPFDEQIKRSGYEDLLFGKRLEQAGIPVRHTTIQATNGDIESNEAFLRKTDGHLMTLMQMQDELYDYSTLLSFRAHVRKCHLLWFVHFCFMIGKGVIRRNLLSANPSLRLFQFYKLGRFEQLRRQKG